jgi:PKD repeat protein
LRRIKIYLYAALSAAFLMSVNLIASYYTVWSEYPVNPVFDPVAGSKAYYPSVVYDAGQFSGHGTSAYYKMWFAGDNGVALAYSNDGIAWTEYNNSAPLSGLIANANHPVVLYDSAGFGGGAYYYKIWYWDGVAGPVTSLHYAESIDGINWVNDQPIQQHATDAALQLIAGWGVYNNYFYHMYGPGCVLYNPAASNTGSATPDDKTDDQPMTYRYIMYYDSSSEGTSPEGSAEQTSLAYSTNGIYWIRYGDAAVLIPSGNGADWDGEYSYRVSVMRIGSQYHMWYSGANGDNSIGTYYAHGIGHATSSDGLNWIKDADNPALHVMDGLAWRNVRSYTPIVIYDAAGFSSHGDAYQYKMWYTGRDAGGNYTIGYAWLMTTSVPPTACFNAAPVEGYSPLTVNFNAGCSTDSDGTITAYNWNFGDQSASSGINRSHTFVTAGQYITTLSVRDNDGLTGTAARTITVNNPLVACFTASIISGFVPFTANFDASCSSSLTGTRIVSYNWDFGNGNTAEGLTSSFTFTEGGDKVITLEITDEDGNTQSISMTIKALKLYPPSDIRLVREINRSLARAEAYHTLIWSRDPNNTAFNIERYNIYRRNMSDPADDYQLIGSVSSDTLQFTDKKLPVKTIYSYYITTVLTGGFESSPSVSAQNVI